MGNDHITDAYLATGYRPPPKFLAPLGTSDMRQPLYEIMDFGNRNRRIRLWRI